MNFTIKGGIVKHPVRMFFVAGGVLFFLFFLPLTRNSEQNPGHLRNFPGIFQFVNFFLLTALAAVGPRGMEPENKAN